MSWNLAPIGQEAAKRSPDQGGPAGLDRPGPQGGSGHSAHWVDGDPGTALRPPTPAPLGLPGPAPLSEDLAVGVT